MILTTKIKTKKSLLILFGFAWAFILNAQFSSPLTLCNDNKGQSIGAFYDFEMGSNTLTNSFLYSIYQNLHIDTTQKKEVTSRLLHENRIGFDSRQGFFYQIKQDTSKPGIIFSIQNRKHFDMQFPKDLLNLALFGNGPFEDKTLYLTETRFNFISYQKIGAGVLRNIGKTKGRYGIMVSYTKGQNYLNGRIKKGELYTAPQGNHIYIVSDISLTTSDTANTKFKNINGNGVAIDLFTQAPYTTLGNQGFVTVQISDIGFIHWNKKSTTYTNDSTYQFEGYTVDNIFQLADSSFHTINTDSIININVHKNHPKTSNSLPAVLNANTLTNYGKFQFIKGFKYMFNSSYKGYYYLQGNYKPNSTLNLSARIAFGGWEKFSGGAGMNLSFKNNLNIQLNFLNLEGIVMSRRHSGFSVFSSITKTF